MALLSVCRNGVVAVSIGALLSGAMVFSRGEGAIPWWFWPLPPLCGVPVVLWDLWRRRGVGEGESGFPLRPADAPGLFAAASAVERKLGVRGGSALAMGLEANASVNARRRWFGPRRRRIVLGLPVLAALSERDLEAVLAHEVAHTLPGSGLGPGWVRWAAAAAGDRLERRGRGEAPLWLLRLRANLRAGLLEAERFADRHAAAATSPEAAASSLLRMAALSAVMEHAVWPALEAQQAHRAAPPQHHYTQLLDLLSRPHPERDRALRLELAHRTGLTDTHPALLERLAAATGREAPGAGEGRERLVEDLVLACPGVPDRSAWSAWLEPGAAAEMLERFDAVFGRITAGRFAAGHARVQAARDALRADRMLLATPALAHQRRLEDPPPVAGFDGAAGEPLFCGPLSAAPFDAGQAAGLVRDALPPAEAAAPLRWLVDRCPGAGEAWLHLALVLAAEPDEASHREALAALRQATRLPNPLGEAALSQLAAQHRRLGHTAAAEEAAAEHARVEADRLALTRRLRRVPDADALAPPRVSPLHRERLRKQLRTVPEIREAHLVSLHGHEVPGTGGSLAHTLLFGLACPWYRPTSEATGARLAAALTQQADLPAVSVVWCLDGAARRLRRPVARVPHGLLIDPAEAPRRLAA